MKEKAILQMVEEARDSASTKKSFARDLFMGNLELSTIFPFPVQPAEDKKAGDAILEKVREFLKTMVDPDLIDREGKIPKSVISGLRKLGLFGMKVPVQYGGLGFSQTNYNRVIHLIASHCSSTAVLLSAHQSIGVGQPLLHFGTGEQKRQFLPRVAGGAISAFALTEPSVGSDPSQMKTTAAITEDGSAYIINGEKLWISNGPVAEIMILMARTSAEDSGHPSISAFIVEGNTPGISSQPCHFMGLRGLSNGLLKFNDVKVPAGNLLGEEGKGLKIALTTLNTGRLTIPAASAAAAKQCLAILRPWINDRKQWGKSIGRHEAVASRVSAIAAYTYALEAITGLTSAMADSGDFDLRLEAAMAKLYSSEVLWKIANDTLQTRGGRGYETADSLEARGELPVPVERILRDARINLIIEGTSDIMRLFIAREALDPHLKATGMKPGEGGGVSFAAAAKFYPGWYTGLYFPRRRVRRKKMPGPLGKHLVYIERETRKLGRLIFHSIVKNRQKLQDRQLTLARFVDIGTRLFVMSTVISKAAADHAGDTAESGFVKLADLLCLLERQEIESFKRNLHKNADQAGYSVAMDIMDGRFSWLEEGIVSSWQIPDYLEDLTPQKVAAPFWGRF